MKLLVQGDDFGFTRGVTLGIVDSIDFGILRNTGLFSNMPSAEFAVGFMADRPQACFGIDFNLVSGPSVSRKEDIPHLVDENGQFIRSGVRMKDPRWQSAEGRNEMFPYEEVYREIRAQYDRFVELVGRKPGYLHTHSLHYENYIESIRQVAREENVPFSQDIKAKYGFVNLGNLKPKGLAATKKVFDPADQLGKNPAGDVLKYGDQLLQAEYANIGGHPGYVDDELLGLTTLSLERVKDAAMCMSPDVLKWVRDNNVELITYYDLVK